MTHLHRLYAWIMGYFWKPCPMCGRMFGGHQVGSHITTWRNPPYAGGLATCNRPDCMEQLKEYNKLELRSYLG